VFDSVINYLDKFGPELLVIQFGFLVIVSTLFLWLWFSNRRKYHNLKHAIPATIVKSYLDSIIQNSTALKSQLFRGGGLEANGVPSVMPLSNFTGGDSMGVSGTASAAALEELNQKRALIASLESQLSTAKSANRELEAKLASTQASLAEAERRIKELEALLAQGGGGDEVLKSQLNNISKERDEIRDRLQEFEIISDDLANLKRLKQENEQLKRSIAAGGSSAPASAPAGEEGKQFLSQDEVSDLLNSIGNNNSQDQGSDGDFAANPDESSAQNSSKPEKTSEDLLSEFEKMLG
jgi:hypothetical protein